MPLLEGEERIVERMKHNVQVLTRREVKNTRLVGRLIPEVWA
jgi:hypothetical protein